MVEVPAEVLVAMGETAGKVDTLIGTVSGLTDQVNQLTKTVSETDRACLKDCKECRQQIDGEISALKQKNAGSNAVVKWRESWISRYGVVAGSIMGTIALILEAYWKFRGMS